MDISPLQQRQMWPKSQWHKSRGKTCNPTMTASTRWHPVKNRWNTSSRKASPTNLLGRSTKVILRWYPGKTVIWSAKWPTTTHQLWLHRPSQRWAWKTPVPSCLPSPATRPMHSNTQTTMLTGPSQQPAHLVPQSLFTVQEKAAMWQQTPPSQTHSILSPSTGVPSSRQPSQMGTNEAANVTEGFSTKILDKISPKQQLLFWTKLLSSRER